MSSPRSRSWTGPGVASTRCQCGPKGGGELTGPNPTDRGKPGTKYHLLTDRNGLPLHVLASAANTHDSRLFEPLLATNPAVRGRRGRPGRHRWVVERTISWVLRFKRLGLRYDRTAAILLPLLLLAVTLVSFHRLRQATRL